MGASVDHILLEDLDIAETWILDKAVDSLISVSDDWNGFQILSGTGRVGIVWESAHDLKVDLLHAELLKETLSSLHWLRYFLLEDSNLVLEGEAETLNGCECLKGVESNQGGV